MRKLMYHKTECSPLQFVAAVAAVSGASQEDSFRMLWQFMEYAQQPEKFHPLAVAKLAMDIDRITYGVCKMV